MKRIVGLGFALLVVVGSITFYPEDAAAGLCSGRCDQDEQGNVFCGFTTFGGNRCVVSAGQLCAEFPCSQQLSMVERKDRPEMSSQCRAEAPTFHEAAGPVMKLVQLPARL